MTPITFGQRIIQFAIAAIFSVSATSCVWAEEGNCNPNVTRESKTLNVNSESFLETENTIETKVVCTGTPVIISKCAIINIKRLKAQQFCFPVGKPAYYEYYNVVEYFGN